MDCTDTRLDYGERLRDDVLNRTETAMPQDHCFRAMELALDAHRLATPLAGTRPGRCRMSRLKVGVVGSGIGASHIEALPGAPRHVRGRGALRHRRRPRRRGRAASSASPPPSAGSSDLLDARPRHHRHLHALRACTRPRRSPRSRPASTSSSRSRSPSSLAEVDAVAAAEAASGRRVCPIFQYRFGHGIQKLRHLMRQGPRRPPLGRHRRDPLVPRRGLLRRRQLARHLRRRARRLPDHPRHPHPRHALRGPRPRSPRCTPAPRTG